MRVIQEPDETFMSLVSGQKVADGVGCRPSSFLICADVPEGRLVYNTMSCEMVLMEGDESGADITAIPYLREHWFAVPDDFDERKLVREYRGMLSLMQDKKKKVKLYTIFTTMECDARCFYCWEKGLGQVRMAEKTAEKVADLVIRNWRKDSPDEKSRDGKSDVTLRWFGGEPLFNRGVIDLICRRVADAGVPYHSEICTNGYLFDEQVICLASSLWNLKMAQITMDGTEKTYNRTKSFIYHEGNPYRRVIRNIGLLLDAGIGVSVKLNIGTHNADDIFCLLGNLADMFGGRAGFSCTSDILQGVGGSPVRYTGDSLREVQGRHLELISAIYESGLFSKSLRRRMSLNNCQADGGKSLVIYATGDIGLCVHFSDRCFISDADTPDVVDMEMVESFREVREVALCGECPLYPQCISLKRCREVEDCTPELVQKRIQVSRMSMKRRYELMKNAEK